MSTIDGSERQWLAIPEEERTAIARQVAEAMDINRMLGVETRVSGCQGCGQCLSKPVTHTATTSGDADLTEQELVRLVQDVVREVIQEYRSRSAR